VKKVEIHLLYPVAFIENRSVYEIMRKHIVERDRPHMTIRHMRIACWLPKAKNTQTRYVILTLFHRKSGCTTAPQYSVIRLLDT
jgi:hypothetical protein